jgi:hypothetical protein
MNGWNTLSAVLIVLVFEASSIWTANSGTTDYSGVWASTNSSCPEEHSDGNYESILVTKDAFGYTAGEGLACTFESVTETAPHNWKIRSRCGYEGDEEDSVSDLWIKVTKLGLQILLKSKQETKKLVFAVRCPDDWAMALQ